MPTAELRWDGDQRWIASDSWGMDVRIDADREGGTGAKPSDLVPISLAACVAYTLRDVLRKRRETIDSITARIDFEQDPEPPWTFRRIDTHFTISGSVDHATADKWLQRSHEKYCSVSASLKATVAMKFTVEVT